MNQTDMRVGTVGFPVQAKILLPDVDAVELTDASSIPPKEGTAKRLKENAPDRVEFSVQLPKYLFESPPSNAALLGDQAGYGAFKQSDENVKLWERAVRFAAGMQAKTLVLITPSSFTPAVDNRNALASFLSTVERQGMDLVWEFHGPWDIERAAEFAKELNALLAVDPLRDDPPEASAAYFRLGPFATMGTRMGMYDLERLVDSASAFERVTCVFDTANALDDARNLKKVIAGMDEQIDIATQSE